MKFSENWLRELVDPGVDRDALVQRLTMAGLEVESVAPLGGSLAGVVVAEIVAAERHPNADKLQVCRVRAGGDELQVVCGAPNARAGLKAPLARVGATLPNGMAIKAAALRGVESHGMLCSAKELALDDDASGLLELPADAPVGKALAEYLALPDATLELKLTPNRPDCLGLRGLASEVGTLFGRPVRETDVGAVPATVATKRGVRLDVPADCPRYCGRAIEGVDAKAPTPLWMAERLRRAGLRPISAIVDCTNYVMLELGQPLHAFDLAGIDGDVVVRRAKDGETLKLLDGRDVVLDREFVAIADGRKALALGGVMGGWDSRVTDDTKDLFLEAAHFAPPAIVGRARRLGMHTDASHRFERGVDPELPRVAIERITKLLLAIVGGKAGPLVEAVEPGSLPRRAPVALRRARLARVLGITVPDARVEAILRGLGMQVTATADGWQVLAPSRRFDIAIEEDLIEEVVRVHGYDAVPTVAPGGTIALRAEPEGVVPAHALGAALRACGYAETINYAFVPLELLQRWHVEAGAVALANPLSADMAVMRTALLPGLVESLKRNLARQQARVRLFETGVVFAAGEGAPRESRRIAGAITGAANAEQWGAQRRTADFHDLKGDVERLAALTGDARAFAVRPAASPWLHPGRSAELLRDGRAVGLLGALHPAVQKALDLDDDVLVFELDLPELTRRSIPKATEPSRFPSVRRDLAVVLGRSVAWADVEAAVRAAVGPRLRELVLFDQYTGAGLEKDTRSLAMGLILQDDSRTLTDGDADESVKAAVTVIASRFGGHLRS